MLANVEMSGARIRRQGVMKLVYTEKDPDTLVDLLGGPTMETENKNTDNATLTRTV